MVRAVFAILGVVAAAFAQEESYTGPMFNPSDAPFFGPSGLVYPTQTPTSIRSVPCSAKSSHAASHSASHSSASHSLSASHSRSASASASGTSTSSKTIESSSTAASSSPPEQTMNVAGVNYPGMIGAIAGGLVAGLALV